MTYLTISDYFGKWRNHPDATAEVVANAEILIQRVNVLLDDAFRDGVNFHLNALTNSYVSGKEYGGFRPQSCPQGAPKSSHKQGKAVDIFDKNNDLDEWLLKHQSLLERYGLYMEHPGATPRWCHLTTRAPGSGKRVFFP